MRAAHAQGKDLASRPGGRHRDDRLGPAPGAAVGSHSQTTGRQATVSSWTGRAGALELAGGRGAPHPDRPTGPSTRSGDRQPRSDYRPTGYGSNRVGTCEHGGTQEPGHSCSIPASGEGRGRGPGLAHAQTRAVVEGHAAGRDGRRPDPSGNQGPPHCLAGSNSLQTQGPGLAGALGRPTGRVPETLRSRSKDCLGRSCRRREHGWTFLDSTHY